MKIDRHGNFYAYRRVKTVGNDSKELVDFISNAYNKIKAVWKKKTKNYEVWRNFNNPSEFHLLKVGDINKKSFEVSLSYIGNLKNLYLDLPNMSENRYTDAHTGKMDYRVGQIASIPRDEGDDDNTVNCGKGLHICSSEMIS